MWKKRISPKQTIRNISLKKIIIIKILDNTNLLWNLYFGTFYGFVIMTTYLQGVPPKGWQHRTKFWKLKNHICQKVSPVLKSLNKNLLDGILKAGIIKLEVFLNLKSKNGVKFQKRFCTVPPEPAPEPALSPPA